MLRFEVAEGALRGARFAVSSHGGVVSAVVVPSGPELSLQLEQLLDDARTSLEDRGIEVGQMEVRTGEERGEDPRERSVERPSFRHDEASPSRPVSSSHDDESAELFI